MKEKIDKSDYAFQKAQNFVWPKSHNAKRQAADSKEVYAMNIVGKRLMSSRYGRNTLKLSSESPKT